jgi:PKD repeat protein
MHKKISWLAVAFTGLVLSAACTVHQDEAPTLTGPSSGGIPISAGPPTAAFFFSPSPAIPNSPVIFDASASTPGSRASALTYAWSFGDGSSGSEKTTTHTFTAPNSYQVTLTVTNDYGLSASIRQAIAVQAGQLPTAEFVFSPTEPTVGQLVQFNASQSRTAAGRTIVSYSWNWGDGKTASNPGPLEDHAYAVAGTYTVTLTVTDDLGQKETTTKTVKIV